MTKAVEKGPVGATYLRSVATGSGGNTHDISWIYLGSDGTVIKDPKFGVDPVSLDEEKKKNAGKTGKYVVNGNKMMITWENGKTAEWAVEQKAGVFSSIDGGSTGRQLPLPANYRLTGQYSAESILPSVSSSTTLAFSKDGSFSQTSFGGVNTASGSSVSQDIQEGSYNISGNTLRLNYSNGQKIISMIAVWALPEGKKFLVINGGVFPQQ